MREKEKLLITSNFSFSHSVFKRLVSRGRQKVSLCGNGLKGTGKKKMMVTTVTGKEFISMKYCLLFLKTNETFLKVMRHFYSR